MANKKEEETEEIEEDVKPKEGKTFGDPCVDVDF